MLLEEKSRLACIVGRRGGVRSVMAEEQGMCERGGSVLPSERLSDRSKHLASSSDGPTSRLPQPCILELESKRTSRLGSCRRPEIRSPAAA